MDKVKLIVCALIFLAFVGAGVLHGKNHLEEDEKIEAIHEKALQESEEKYEKYVTEATEEQQRLEKENDKLKAKNDALVENSDKYITELEKENQTLKKENEEMKKELVTRDERLEEIRNNLDAAEAKQEEYKKQISALEEDNVNLNNRIEDILLNEKSYVRAKLVLKYGEDVVDAWERLAVDDFFDFKDYQVVIRENKGPNNETYLHCYKIMEDGTEEDIYVGGNYYVYGIFISDEAIVDLVDYHNNYIAK